MYSVLKQLIQSVFITVIHVNRNLFFDKQFNNGKGNQLSKN